MHAENSQGMMPKVKETRLIPWEKVLAPSDREKACWCRLCSWMKKQWEAFWDAWEIEMVCENQCSCQPLFLTSHRFCLGLSESRGPPREALGKGPHPLIFPVLDFLETQNNGNRSLSFLAVWRSENMEALKLDLCSNPSLATLHLHGLQGVWPQFSLL